MIHPGPRWSKLFNRFHIRFNDLRSIFALTIDPRRADALSAKDVFFLIQAGSFLKP
jgi:hypothetical protein